MKILSIKCLTVLTVGGGMHLELQLHMTGTTGLESRNVKGKIICCLCLKIFSCLEMSNDYAQ